MAVLSSFINNGRFIKVEDQASGRSGRFINQKRRNGQIGLRMADFILPRIRSLSARAGPTGFPKQVSETQNGRMLEAAAFAARSLCRNTGGPDYQGRGPGQWPQWPFYQPEADKWPDL